MLNFILHARLRAHRAPGIPCALCSAEGRTSKQNSRGSCGEIADVRLGVIASASEAIHFAAQRKNGLLRRVAPRNDGLEGRRALAV